MENLNQTWCIPGSPIYLKSLKEMFNEFDLWITPSLFEIKDTDKYRQALANTKLLLELIGIKTKEFSSLDQFDVTAIVDAVLNVANQLEDSSLIIYQM